MSDTESGVQDQIIINNQEAESSSTSTADPKERRKIEIKFIENKTRRHVTFSKRKHGIMKKAFELSVLTGTQVLLLVVSETGLVYTFSTPKFEPIVTQQEGRNLIQACLNAPDDEDEEEEDEDGEGDDNNVQTNINDENDEINNNNNNNNNNTNSNMTSHNNIHNNINGVPNNAENLVPVTTDIHQENNMNLNGINSMNALNSMNQAIANVGVHSSILNNNNNNNSPLNQSEIKTEMKPTVTLENNQVISSAGTFPNQYQHPQQHPQQQHDQQQQQQQQNALVQQFQNAQNFTNVGSPYLNSEQSAVYQQYFQESQQNQF